MRWPPGTLERRHGAGRLLGGVHVFFGQLDVITESVSAAGAHLHHSSTF